MPDAKISALTAVTTAAGTDEFAVNQGAASKKETLAQITQYVEDRLSATNASVTTPAAGFATDTYLVGSSCAIPASGLQAKSMYRCKFSVSKTAAGLATPILNVRIGTAGTTADTTRGTMTFVAQTAAIDEGLFEVFSTFRTVGAGTAAVLQSVGVLVHRLSVTGLATVVSGTQVPAASAGFDSTVANSIIGLSVNGGASAVWTIALVQAELFNLAV